MPTQENRTMSIIRGAVGATAAAVLITLLSGCSVGLVDGSDAVRPDATRTDAGTQSEPKPSASSGQKDDAGESPLTGDGATPDRKTISAAATTVRRCNADGELTILDDDIVARVDGACTRIILNATGSMLVTDDVGYLEVIGDGNVALAGRVEKVLVNGEGNTVHWTGATPAVTDVGSGNTITAG